MFENQKTMKTTLNVFFLNMGTVEKSLGFLVSLLEHSLSLDSAGRPIGRN